MKVCTKLLQGYNLLLQLQCYHYLCKVNNKLNKIYKLSNSFFFRINFDLSNMCR